MKKLIFSLVLGVAFFASSFVATTLAAKRFIAVDDCPACAASVNDTNGKRCILNR